MTWTDGGWPIIGNNGYVELEMEDILPATQKPISELFVDFGRNLENYPLLKLRVPKNDCFIQKNYARKLILVGEEDINTPLGHPTLLAVRQSSFDCIFKAELELSSLEGKAGITAWLRTDYHYRLEIRRNGNSIICSLFRHVHDFEAKTAELILDAKNTSSVRLTMDIKPESYSFLVNDTLVDSCSYAGLTTTCALGNCFTGTLLGIYAEHGKATFVEGMRLVPRGC